MKPRTRLLDSALMIAVVASLVPSQCPAQEQQDRQRRRSSGDATQRLKTQDKNGDGKISKDEASDQLKRHFGRVDTNNDGFIDKAELQKLSKRFRGRSRPQTGNRKPARVPPSVELVTDLAYREGNEAWKLDLAMPKDRGDAPRPGLVIIHGGGWRSGDKGGGQWRSLPIQYAAEGYVCISVNYRLVDDAPFPACVEDVKCAVRWLRANAKKYNVDPKKIGGYGNSAGAHLVAMLGLVGPDRKLEGDGPYQDQSSLLQAVCCSATPTDFTNWSPNADRFGREGGLLSGPGDTLADRAKQASPITYVHPDAPPFLVIHGTADPLVRVSQGDRFVEALKSSGAKDVTYMRFDEAKHGVFGQHSEETGPAMERFFSRTLGKSE